MPGAIIRIDQDRPGPSTSTGTAGRARDDLWVGRTVRPTSVNISTSYAWTMLDKPPGSATTINSPTSRTCDFTPDLPGSYRIELVFAGGGAGNVSIKVAACTFDFNGVQTNRGWRIPAVGEVPPENDFAGNANGYDPSMRFIINDILNFLQNPPGNDTWVVFNDGETWNAVAGMAFNKATNTLTATHLAGTDLTVTTVAATNVNATNLTGSLPGASVSGAVALATLATSATTAATAALADDLSIVGEVQGSVLYFDGANWVQLAPSTDGKFLETHGPAANPTWAAPVVIPIDVSFTATDATISTNTFTRIGGRQVDMSQFPATIAGLTRSIAFLVDLEMSPAATSAEVKLFDLTNLVDVTATDLTTSSLSLQQLSSGALTVGAGAGDIRNDAPTMYEVYLKMNGGTEGSDLVTCTNARLVVTYA